MKVSTDSSITDPTTRSASWEFLGHRRGRVLAGDASVASRKDATDASPARLVRPVGPNPVGQVTDEFQDFSMIRCMG